MEKTKLFNKGDIIQTNPENGYYGIAVVLSEKEKTVESHPKCHIAISPIIFDKEIKFEDLDLSQIKPFNYGRIYSLENQEEFVKYEITIGVYTRRNKHNFKIIGKIDPNLVYDGPLPFEPYINLKITWPLCGDANELLGREAYINWKRIQ